MKLAGAESEFQGEIPLDRVTPQNIVQQVSEYFRGQAVGPQDGPGAKAVVKGSHGPDAKAVAKAGK